MFSGNLEYKAKTSKTCNEVKFFTKGECKFTFKDGQTISFNFPAAVIKGMMFGEKTSNFEGLISFID